MRARQPRKHMSHMGSTQMITINPDVARTVAKSDLASKLLLPRKHVKIDLKAQEAKAATAKKYWLIGGGITLAAIVGGVLIYKSKDKG